MRGVDGGGDGEGAGARDVNAGAAGAAAMEHPPGGRGPVAEERQSLWLMIAAPTIWALHFLASYVTAAVWCAKAADPSGPLGGARTIVMVLTVVALAGIAVAGGVGWRRYRLERAVHHDTPEARHGFLGLTMVLLAALSTVAVVFVALPVLFTPWCL